MLVLFTFTTIFPVTTVASVKNDDNEFFGVLPENYYDPRDYGEEIPFSEQLDEETSLNDDDNNNNDNTLLPTITDNYIESTTTNYLSENYSDDINFIAAGDWSCNKETKKTINKITKLKPELVLGLGDYTYKNISPQCWFDISEPIDDIIKIAIGNHDLDYQSSYYQLLDHYNLLEPYYSFDFYNIHFIAISSEHPFEKGSKQYEFIKSDLEESLQDPSILWRIVFLHKPMYTSADFDKKDSEKLKNTFHKLFEKYQVDLVLSGHTQYYQRSLPISYNNDDATIPVVMDHNNNEYNNQDGIIFVTAGTAGDNLHKITYFLPYYTIQKDKFGFLNFELENKGHTLIGTFYDTDDLDILDRFVISKDNDRGKKTFSEKEA
ncbi:MAG TPA: metallophosphoesterase [Nitrososphaeraceae archaeon]